MLVGLKCKVRTRTGNGYDFVEYEVTIASTPQMDTNGDFFVLVLTKENKLGVVDTNYLIEVIHV